MEYLNALMIDSLKGIRHITLEHFAAVNLITGPNASGKSTLLDAIELISNPAEPVQFFKLAKSFPFGIFHLTEQSEIRPYCKISGTLLDKPYHTEFVSCESASDATLCGYHSYLLPKNGVSVNHTQKVEFSLKDNITDSMATPMVPVKRIANNYNHVSLASILKDKTVYEKTLSFLSLFDNRIIDIASPDFKNTYIIHEVYKHLDAEFFSEGIRKVLGIASEMAGFRNGILLMDDLEAHLAPKTLYEVVSLLYSLAKERKIQLFITTHSQELLDEWLDNHSYENRN